MFVESQPASSNSQLKNIMTKQNSIPVVHNPEIDGFGETEIKEILL